MAVRIIEKFDELELNSATSDGKREERGAVLVFLPGLLEIETLYKACEEYSQSKSKDNKNFFKWLLLPLHSTISKEDQDKVFQPAYNGYRKVILATNIAESSITVTDIRYVIDFCLTKSLSCDPNTNYTCLRMEWASKNQCIQRKGRCGRVATGQCYRMVPKGFYNNLVQEAAPEMEKSSLESVVLHAKILDMGTPKDLLATAIDPPQLSGIQRAVANLKEAGALTIGEKDNYSPHDGELTYLGRIMSKLPIDIRFGRLIAMGYIFGVLEESIIISAGLSTKSPFSYPYHRRLDAYMSKLSWSNSSFSDCVALVHVYRAWIELETEDWKVQRQWANHNLVQLNVMKEITNIVREIQRRLAHSMGIQMALTYELTPERELLLKIAIAGAFYPNYFVYSKRKQSEFSREVAKELLGRDPLTNVVFQGFPQEQPAALYAQHILRPFEKGNTKGCTVPHMELSGSKVVLYFDPKGQKVGIVSKGVYMAVKMRNLRQNLSFRVVPSDESVADLNRKIERLGIRGFLEAPEETSLPSIIQKSVSVKLCCISSPGEFYVITKDNFGTKALIDKELKYLQDNKLLQTIKSEECERGALVIVKHENILYRARIEFFLGRDKLVLNVIDAGALIVKSLEEIFSPKTDVPKTFQTAKALALPCRLKECKPLVIYGGIWQPENDLQKMHEFVEKYSNLLHFEIFSIVDGVMAGDLMSLDKTDSLIECLRKEGFVDYTPETLNSTHNYYSLRLSSSVAREPENVLEQMTAEQGMKKYVQSNLRPPSFYSEEVAERFPEVTLRGPSSPLEMSFAALCRSSHLKQVLIDPASINSVALDCEILVPCSRLLVAASIGIAHRSGSLMGRETTLLPAIPNLTGIMTLLFCPKMELRVDRNAGIYTGALAGLGVDPIINEPIYGDHDVEVMFDTTIDNADITMINEIRNCMNKILQADNRDVLETLRKKCQDGVRELLTRERETKDIEWPVFLHKWGVLEAEGLISETPVDQKSSDVFMIHQKIDLASISPTE